MRLFTSHLKPGAPPVLVREGFSFGAAFFGFFWLLWQRAWIPAILDFAVLVLISSIHNQASGPLTIGLFLLQGCFGRDLVRWSVARRGYAQGPVVAALNTDGAFVRLLTERPDLFPDVATALR